MREWYVPMFRLSLAGLLALFGICLPARADFVFVTGADLVGSRTSSDPSELEAGGAWGLPNGFTVHWIIAVASAEGTLWSYHYWFSAPTGGVSHWVVEVSPSFRRSNILEYGLSSLEGPRTFGTGPENSNPNIPGSIFGAKWDPGEIWFLSDRAPIWGDFYARNGVAGDLGRNYAFNANFGWDPDIGTTDFSGWVPTPDTLSSVPEPASVVLLGITVAALGLAYKSRLRRRS